MKRAAPVRKKTEGEYHHGDLRKALVDAAVRLVAGRDPRELSLREVARMVGVSPRAPYRHFVSKEALLAAVAVQGFHEYGERLHVELATVGDDPIAAIFAWATSYVTFAVECPGYFSVMHSPYETVEESTPELLRVRSEGHAIFLALIVQAQKENLIRAGDPMHIAFAAWSSMHGVAVLLVQKQVRRYERAADPRIMAKLAGAMLYEGLKPRP